MPSYAANHVLLRANGSFGPDAATEREYWTCGMRIALGAATLSEDKKTAFLQTVQSAVMTFHTGNALAPAYAFLKTLTAAYIGTDGHYVGGGAQPTTTFTYSTPPVGASSVVAPYQNARVYSLLTNIDRGRGSRGRFYWPVAATPGNDGLYSATAATNAATAAKTMLDAINGAATAIWGAGSHVAVFTGTGSNQVGTVIRVEVGRVPDVQRRRAKSLLEDYKGVDLATVAAERAEVGSREY